MSEAKAGTSRAERPSTPTTRSGMELPRSLQQARRWVPRRQQVWAREAIRRYGVATAGRRPLPDFLVIGTKKGGTTSLINWLVRHPHVLRMFPPAQKLKSSHYFDINYARGERWYRSHFPTEATRRRRERQVGGPVVVGEASPYYMFHPAVPQRVVETGHPFRAIALLRDPVARAHSNYWDRRATGNEPLATFEEALAAEPERLAQVDHRRLREDPSYYAFSHDHHTYLARGRYLEHLQAWLDLLPRERLLILSAEQMFRDPVGVFGQVQDFLGIPRYDGLDLQPYNLRRRADLDPVTLDRLAAYYRPHNAALYAALGQDLGWEADYPTPSPGP